MIVDGKILGMLTGATTIEYRDWLQEESDFANGLANIAALVLQRTMRQSAEKVEAERAASLSRKQAQISELMQNPVIRSGALTEAMKLLTRHMVDVMEVDRGSIKILSPDHATIACGAIFDAKSGTLSRERCVRQPIS